MDTDKLNARGTCNFTTRPASHPGCGEVGGGVEGPSCHRKSASHIPAWPMLKDRFGRRGKIKHLLILVRPSSLKAALCIIIIDKTTSSV